MKLPPQHGIAGRYAAALYMAAVKSDALSKVESELSSVAQLMSESKDFSTFIADPSVPRNTKLDGLDAVLSKMGASEITKNFVGEQGGQRRRGEGVRLCVWVGRGGAGLTTWQAGEWLAVHSAAAKRLVRCTGCWRAVGKQRSTSAAACLTGKVCCRMHREHADGLRRRLTAARSCRCARPPAGLLSANNRLVELGKIVSKFEEIAAEQRGEVKAMVTTAEVRTLAGCRPCGASGSRRLVPRAAPRAKQSAAGCNRQAGSSPGGAPATPLHPAQPSSLLLPAAAAQGLSAEEVEEIKRGLQPLLKPGQKLTLEEVVSGWSACAGRGWYGGGM